MATIKRTTTIILALLLLLSSVATADAQRRVGRVRSLPNVDARGVQPQTVEYHPWPAATCPICATRVAREVVANLQTQGRAAEEISESELRSWLDGWGVEVNPALVRSRLGMARDHELLASANAESGGSSYSIEVESRVAPNGKATYVVYDGGETPIYIGSRYTEMIRVVRQQGGSASSFNVRGRNLPRAKTEAIRRSLGVQSSASMVSLRPSTASLPSGYTTPGARLVEGSITEPTFVRRGKFKGFYTSSLRFINAGRQLTLRGYARAKEVVRSMMDTIAARMSGNPSRVSMQDLVKQARAELQGRYNITEQDLLILLKDELMNTFFVQIPQLSPNSAE